MISLVDYWEYMSTNILEWRHTSHKLKDVYVETPTGYNPLLEIHECERDHLWDLSTNNGMELQSNPAHHMFGELDNRVNAEDLKSGEFIDTISGRSTINKSQKSNMKFRVFQIDITVKSDDHLYFANNVLVHNCVSPFTTVQVKNVTRGKRMRMPVFRVLYSQVTDKGWRDILGNVFLEVAYWFHLLSLPSSSHNGTKAA